MTGLWENKSVKHGERGDSMFVKIAAVLAWGKNYLATHSVTGKKRKNVDPNPPLDEVRLKAVRGKLHCYGHLFKLEISASV